MENNKILIGAQFTNKANKSYTLELYVPRDITLYQLIEGIKYGLKKASANDTNVDHEVYVECLSICNETIGKISVNADGEEFFAGITVSSCNTEIAKEYFKNVKMPGKATDSRVAFLCTAAETPICDLGFVTSTKLIFDATGSLEPFSNGGLSTSHLIDAFNPRSSKFLFFPEYNISTRQLYKFDTTPIEIIAPTDAPQKPNNNLFFMLLPSLLTVGIMVVVRSLFSGGSVGGNIAMLALTVAMGIVGIVTTIITWKRQKMEYRNNLKNWRKHYQDYIDSTIEKIKDRQYQDAKKMDELYPDITKLIQEDEKGIYSANSNIYSRSSHDDDFLTFRMGVTDSAKNLFEIKGEARDVVYSETFFDIVKNNKGKDNIRIFLRSELEKKDDTKENLCRLPGVISKKYRFMEKSPLLYSLKDKSCLGIVDKDIQLGISSLTNYFISRMIFELCYYHSPEDLQFIVFFNKRDSWEQIENDINMYKFMPHFHGLFDDKSQFVFNKENAEQVMSSLLNIMIARREHKGEESSAAFTHIVMIIMEEHGLKEHAFAEFLPSSSKDASAFCKNYGLTFVFAKKYKEYLPAYCDDIVYLDGTEMSLQPRTDLNETKHFTMDVDLADGKDTMKVFETKKTREEFMVQFMRSIAFAFRFLSPLYYSRIAQNGKVPSSVSMFELMQQGKSDVAEYIDRNWHFGSKVSSVKEGLSVAIGKTESETTYLDLHERADGPHMLVAGTTGSGKTETIITFLLGLCMKYRPDEVNLLLVDMKGGGFTKRLGQLPHVVGAVTDVDGDENGTGAEYMLGRFLAAMKSEIKRRKILFNKLLVDSIDAYIEACEDIEAHITKKQLEGNVKLSDEIRETAKENPLTHLILVVDEFTELKRFSNENNDLDFMGEITTIARVGRSLGFHIILISQNIEGAITDDIRVNSKARLCLKVATKQASKEMIGTDLAASPYMPGNGRAYLLVGTGSKFVYFQSGYSGTGINEIVPIEFILADKRGSYSSFYRSDKDNESYVNKQREQKKSGMAKTQLDIITDSIKKVYKLHENEFKIHQVFRAPLPRRIVLEENDEIKVLSQVEEEKPVCK